MWPNPQFPADLVAFIEEILNRISHFFWSGREKDCLHRHPYDILGSWQKKYSTFRIWGRRTSLVIWDKLPTK